jgi:hypothetical protein
LFIALNVLPRIHQRQENQDKVSSL